MLEKKSETGTIQQPSESAANEVNNSNQLSESGRKLVSLIVRIIVNATIRQCYEKESD